MINFKRYPHRVGEPVRWTQRMATMAKNKPERQARKLRKKLPLLAEQIEGGSVDNFDEEAERLKRQKRIDNSIQFRRDCVAKTWRNARKAFFACDADTQERILKQFNGNRWMPKTAVNFAGVVDKESGAQARRLAEIEKRDKAMLAELEDKQADLFGEMI